ncbi:hypothetical protein GGS21DRAFT_517065 [Xylaria nigripes]|nr:hypothetical protein GGS21DRAFT_517065 [Xylaria nigripes]
MKHRTIIQRAWLQSRSLHYRLGPFGLRSSFQRKLGITASSGASQKEILDQLSQHALKRSREPGYEVPGTDGVAILASREFTSWLEDKTFMSAFLEVLFKSMRTTEIYRLGLNVLSGITDSISSHRLTSEARSGFSVLWGPTSKNLPGLWNEDGFIGTSQDSTSCVSFVTAPFASDTGALEVTLPLANTVFQNGRRSSLYASKWEVNSNGSVTLLKRKPKMTQKIATLGRIARTSSTIPLLPVTPPRKIIAGLGNIVRQVEVDGAATPASKELETIIPRLFEERAKRDPNSSPTPIGVWCWVIPPHVMQSPRFNSLTTFKANSPQTEVDMALESMNFFSELLQSGCHLHKILSGGGGWGQKQGLLSLDPDTTFSLPGNDDDMEMFIESFKQRDNAEATGVGLATPGSYLLFCVEPQITNTEAQNSELFVPTKGSFILGVAPDPDHTPSPSTQSSSVGIIEDYFGASSAAGLYLRGMPGLAGRSTHDGDGSTSRTSRNSFTTKINVPGAHLFY